MSKPSMLSSFEGQIKDILIVLPGIKNEMVVEEYDQIVKALDKEDGVVYRFQVDVPKATMRGDGGDRGHGDGWEKATYRGETYRYVEDIKSMFDWQMLNAEWQDELGALQSGNEPLYYKRWAQDPFVTLAWNGAAILLKSTFNTRMCDFFLPFEIAAQGGKLIFVKPTELYLEGGNLLRGMNSAFVGSNTILDNRHRIKKSRAEVIDLLKETLNVDEIIEVGVPVEDLHVNAPVYRDGSRSAGAQPVFHIDLFMNLGGQAADGKRELIFLANTQLTRDLLAPSENGRVRRLMALLPSDDPFEGVRRSLDASRFEVVDLPIFQKSGVWYSWNNCLVEVDGDHKQVYLPSYHSDTDGQQLNATFQTLEQEVKRIYESRGFKVVWIKDGDFFRKIAQWGGSLHCITKVLRRESASGA